MGSKTEIVYNNFCEVLKERNYGYIVMKVNVSDIVSHYTCKDSSTVCVSSFKVSPHSNLILLCTVLLIGNLNIYYLKY